MLYCAFRSTFLVFLISATNVSTVGQYIMSEQADHKIHWLGSSQACVLHLRSPYHVRSIVNVAYNKAFNAHYVTQLSWTGPLRSTYQTRIPTPNQEFNASSVRIISRLEFTRFGNLFTHGARLATVQLRKARKTKKYLVDSYFWVARVSDMICVRLKETGY